MTTEHIFDIITNRTDVLVFGDEIILLTTFEKRNISKRDEGE